MKALLPRQEVEVQTQSGAPVLDARVLVEASDRQSAESLVQTILEAGWLETGDVQQLSADLYFVSAESTGKFWMIRPAKASRP